MTRVLALSGGIGTGKSTVAAMLRARGAVVIDADEIVHRLQARGAPMLAELVAAFGPGILDTEGALDRKRLGERVFGDPEARRRLEAIVHPKVGLEMARQLDAARRAKAPLVVLDIPLLFESRAAGARGGASALPFEATVLVYAPRALQLARTIARDGCSAEQAEARLAAQLPIDEKRALADHVIDNGGSLAETERQVDALWEQLAG
ncbi:MAG: dephospho-CoA kinase [Deltaproteobacteria bacterium]|nr:dephospho-CoA kinase [Deltaproteobacteria bacterium]